MTWLEEILQPGVFARGRESRTENRSILTLEAQRAELPAGSWREEQPDAPRLS